MKIKQLIECENGTFRVSFHVDDNGSLILEVDDNLIEIPHLTALELLEYLRLKLYQHQETNESLLKRIFR